MDAIQMRVEIDELQNELDYLRFNTKFLKESEFEEIMKAAITINKVRINVIKRLKPEELLKWYDIFSDDLKRY